MADLQNNRRFVLFFVLLLVIAGVGIGGYKLLKMLFFEPKKQEQILNSTGSETHYRADIFLGGDSFSGYAPLRKAIDTLGVRGVRMHWVDDKADYNVRIRRLRENKINLAVFDISSFIKASASIGELPGTILFVIDESTGADGIAAYKSTFPTLSDINSPDTKVVLVPDSPSDTLMRAVMADMNLSRLQGANWACPVESAKEVYERFMDGQGRREVYVLWEPYLSRALAHPNAVLLTDTSKRRATIVDILVVNRQYLLENQSLVGEVVDAYFTTLFSVNTSARLTALVKEDAGKYGEQLTIEQAAALVSKISWRNTLENFAHFGLTQANGLMHVEDMCTGVMRVLLETGSLARDPTAGKPSLLYYKNALAQLQTSGFHPGKEEIAVTQDLAPLSESEWNALSSVAEMRVLPIAFSSGRSRLTPEAEMALSDLATRLSNWPSYYLEVKGETLGGGDADANRILALTRAEVVRRFLVDNKVATNRVRAVATSGAGGSSAVRFVVKLKPY